MHQPCGDGWLGIGPVAEGAVRSEVGHYLNRQWTCRTAMLPFGWVERRVRSTALGVRQISRRRPDRRASCRHSFRPSASSTFSTPMGAYGKEAIDRLPWSGAPRFSSVAGASPGLPLRQSANLPRAETLAKGAWLFEISACPLFLKTREHRPAKPRNTRTRRHTEWGRVTRNRSEVTRGMFGISEPVFRLL